MKLHIKDRLLIPSLFPEKGNFMEYNLKKAILKKIAITDKDREDYGIVENQDEKRIEWNLQKDAEVPFVAEFSKEELEYLHNACEAISEQKLTDDLWIVVEHIYNETQS